MVKKGFNYGTIQSIAVAYLTIWSISPPLEIDMIYRVLALGAVFLWAACWLLRENPVELDKNQIVSIFFLFVVGIFFCDEFGVCHKASLFVFCEIIGYQCIEAHTC